MPKLIDILPDIEILGIHGLINGEIVDLGEPGAIVMIVFKDHLISNERIFRYFPEEDEFYEDQTKSFKLMEADKEVIRGRLAEITGLVAEDPLPPRNCSLADYMAVDIKEEMDRFCLEWIAMVSKKVK